MSETILLVRFVRDGYLHLGIGEGSIDKVLDLGDAFDTVQSLHGYVKTQGVPLVTWCRQQLVASSNRLVMDPAALRLPLEPEEVWAAGVTYEMSREARREETTAQDDFYGKVYDAARPEIFFKAPKGRSVGPNDFVGLRRDACWQVPEPELTVILDEQGAIFGYTVGNDMTARDIEAINPLYLPQTKLFHHSTSLGPAIALAETIDPYQLEIELAVFRHDELLFRQETSTQRLRRRIDELVHYLGHEWPLAPWTALMTGTGLVPPEYFALEDGDRIEISITGIGTLRNSARLIDPSWVKVAAPASRILQIDPRDTVAVCLRLVQTGDEIVLNGQVIRALDAIPFGHKIALKAMVPGDPVIKYGEVIGVCTQAVDVGGYVHVHNVDSNRGRGDLIELGGLSS